MKNVSHLSHPFVFCCLIGSVALFGCPGCGSGDRADQSGTVSNQDGDHDHDHDHPAPEGFAAEVAVLRGHFETIRDALGENDVSTAHDPLHEVGHLLENLPKLADQAGLNAEDLATAKAAITAMFEAYGQIDQAIHGDKDVDYESVREKLDQGMADLDAVVERAKSGT